jgi:Mlc titration factor MtfA (ptsG expression regulator)
MESHDLEMSAGERTRGLPYFVKRMSTDHWHFMLELSNGKQMEISHLCTVSEMPDGSIWLDVLVTDAPCSRNWASINAAHVVAAYEIADT